MSSIRGLSDCGDCLSQCYSSVIHEVLIPSSAPVSSATTELQNGGGRVLPTTANVSCNRNFIWLIICQLMGGEPGNETLHLHITVYISLGMRPVNRTAFQVCVHQDQVLRHCFPWLLPKWYLNSNG